MSKNYIQLDVKDNIIVAITALSKGTVVTIAGKQIVLQQDIKQKHKFALHDFNPTDKIFMYGVLIGKATTTIKAGSAITTENIKSETGSKGRVFICPAQTNNDVTCETCMACNQMKPADIVAFISHGTVTVISSILFSRALEF